MSSEQLIEKLEELEVCGCECECECDCVWGKEISVLHGCIVRKRAIYNRLSFNIVNGLIVLTPNA